MVAPKCQTKSNPAWSGNILASGRMWIESRDFGHFGSKPPAAASQFHCIFDVSQQMSRKIAELQNEGGE